MYSAAAIVLFEGGYVSMHARARSVHVTFLGDACPVDRTGVRVPDRSRTRSLNPNWAVRATMIAVPKSCKPILQPHQLARVMCKGYMSMFYVSVTKVNDMSYSGDSDASPTSASVPPAPALFVFDILEDYKKASHSRRAPS